MQAREALQELLAGALQARWRDRFIGFASSERHQAKLLAALHHELLDHFDRRVFTDELPRSAWSQPAFGFSSYHGFGTQHTSLRRAHEELDCSVLAVTADGRFGFYREEDLYDTELLIDLSAKGQGR